MYLFHKLIALDYFIFLQIICRQIMPQSMLSSCLIKITPSTFKDSYLKQILGTLKLHSKDVIEGHKNLLMQFLHVPLSRVNLHL